MNEANQLTQTLDAETADANQHSVKIIVRQCSCPQCVSLCQRNPGWMTPQEAVKAISAGHRNRLMRDWLEPCIEVGNDERIYLIAAASVGCEGNDAPEFNWMSMIASNRCKGRCTFLSGGMCEIHTTDYKPKQCRESFGCEKSGPSNYEMARLWNTDEGREAIDCWLNS